MDLGSQSVNELLASLAAKQPTPGGGAVAGLLAGLSSSLGQMVLAYTEGKKKYAKYEAMLDESVSFFRTASQEAITLGNADADAYETLNVLWKLDKEDPKRIASWDDALANAIEVPFQTMQLCERVLTTINNLVGKTNAMLVSDLVIASILAEASARSARLNVEINLRQMEDGKERNTLQEKTTALLASCITICKSIEDAC
jgi:formiminotetrahydrofolate cyclodeaminase